MPSKNFSLQPGWSQADQRDYAIWYDQHKCAKFPNGRPWWSVVERPAEGATMPMPVGELQPKDWSAPWLPESKYIIASLGKATPGATLQEHRFRIDYSAMITDRRAAMKDYYDRAVVEAIGQGWEAPNFGEPISYRLRAIVGDPPLSPKIPEAAMAEDPWLLGFSSQENEQLARLLDIGHEDILTAAQSEKKVDRMAEMQAQLAEAQATMQALLKREADREQKMADKMAKARAGKKGKADTVTTG